MTNRLETLRVFCTAADASNFREAALRLGVSPQVVTRAVQALEDELGEPLFHRSTRGVQPTAFGLQLAAQARSAVGGVDALFHRSDRRAPSQLSGVVRVAAPGVFRSLLPQALAPLLREHPGLALDLRLSEVVADVVEQQIDVGVRIGPLRDSRFVVRPVRSEPMCVVGTPDLRDRTGSPASLEALFQLPQTALIDRNSGRPWPWLFSAGRQMVVATPAFTTDDVDAECQAVLAGLGWGQLLRTMAQPHLDSGALVEVLAAEAPTPLAMYVYRTQRSPVPARVRRVFDALVGALEKSE